MAVSRGGVAFSVSCVWRLGRRFPVRGQSSNLSQVVDCQWFCPTRPLSSASWALAPPNSLKYQSIKRVALSHPSQHASQPQSGTSGEGWPGSFSLCVLVRQGEAEGLHTLVEVPLPDHSRVGQFFTLGPYRPSELAFPLTTVDGSREDDISVGGCRSGSREAAQRQHGCFRSLFEAERCPAPFADGSRFYCFHCPGLEPGTVHKSRPDAGPDKETLGQVGGGTSLCSHAQGVEGHHHEGDPEREEKLALMYERLRTELPSFFTRSHDFTMYSSDMEFINGLMNTRTRGRLPYQLTLSLCRLLCLCCCAEARLEVLKLTKHTEDGTIKARWRIRGLPFHSLLLRFYQKDKSHLYRSYDAFSTFYIGQDGLIHCHKVEKVMPAQPPILPRITSLLAGALVALGVQEHRPALNLLPLLLSSLRQIRN